MSSGNVLLDVTDIDIHDTHSVTAVNGSTLNVGVAVTGTYGTLFIAAERRCHLHAEQHAPCRG